MSESYKLDKKELFKILKGISLAGGGAIATYLLNILPSIDFGSNSVIVAAIISSILNGLLKFIKNNKEK